MKLIFVTGGVLSGIGKGIVAASVGAILRASGHRVFLQKLDGYLNVDPGTMSPFQHGEVFVTEDGAETDLDLGHYERFTGENMSRLSSFTSGKLYEEILMKERRGDYLGKTVQIVPHLTDLVKEKIRLGYTEHSADVSIIEIGGTVWDIENEYFLESARQLQNELGRDNVIFIHVALLPYLAASKELKTKPIQHSLRTLMGYGIVPDFLVARSDVEVDDEIRKKLASSCSLTLSHVIPAPTLDSIYKVPTYLQQYDLGTSLMKALHLPISTCDMSAWQALTDNISHSSEELHIAMVGKYNDLEDAYYSLNEGLKAAGFTRHKKVVLDFIDATELEKNGAKLLQWKDGICVPGGFGERGIEWMILAAKYARQEKIPYLGICLGSQIMAIEFARNILGLPDAHSQEFAPDGKNNVVHIMPSQKSVTTKGGTMRLGSYGCTISEGTLAHRVYATNEITERHRHRFEFNNEFREQMREKGFVVSATSENGTLAEIVEITDHPFMIGTQAHPELKSRPLSPHPLFVSFIDAMSTGEKKWGDSKNWKAQIKEFVKTAVEKIPGK